VVGNSLAKAQITARSARKPTLILSKHCVIVLVALGVFVEVRRWC